VSLSLNSSRSFNNHFVNNLHNSCSSACNIYVSNCIKNCKRFIFDRILLEEFAQCKYYQYISSDHVYIFPNSNYSVNAISSICEDLFLFISCYPRRFLLKCIFRFHLKTFIPLVIIWCLKSFPKIIWSLCNEKKITKLHNHNLNNLQMAIAPSIFYFWQYFIDILFFTKTKRKY